MRNAIAGIVSGNGGFDLGTVPSYQQQNRYKTVPFVNNHDTFRPEKDANGYFQGLLNIVKKGTKHGVLLYLYYRLVYQHYTLVECIYW